MKNAAMVDYYQVLGVPKSASLAEIKRAYRRLALVHHPDRQGDTAQILLINEAYAILKDKQKRAKYDVIHAMHFSMMGKLATHAMTHIKTSDKMMANLQKFEQRTQILSNFVQTQWQKNHKELLNNAKNLWFKVNHLSKSKTDTPSITIDEKLAKLGGRVCFDYQGLTVRTNLPAGLTCDTKVKLMIKGVPIWFVIKIDTKNHEKI